MLAGRQLNKVALQVRPVAEDEMFKVLATGKRKKKQWKRMVTKVCVSGV